MKVVEAIMLLGIITIYAMAVVLIAGVLCCG